MRKFCDAETRNEFADFLKISRSQLSYVLFVKHPHSYYKTFEIPKKSGGTRVINAPYGELKFIQEQLNKRLAEYQKYIWEVKGVRPAISHGFEKGKSIITNAKIHRNKRYVVNLDIENFFGTFHFGRIVGFFEKNRYFRLPHEVAITIAQITCYNGTLPQGAPSSPIITNYICQVLDRRLLLLAREYRLDYTRYADDITFSTNDIHFTDKYRAFLDAVDTEIQRAGFRINSKKTRLLFESSRQEVTGLTVNKKINSNKQFRKETRAMAYHMYANGEFSIAGDSGTLEQLEGRFSFIDQIEHYNNSLSGNKKNYHNLSGCEREYQKFLFYKYFFANQRPLILTEGKTDVRYLKAALRNLYNEYPTLIKKNEDGSFQFEVSFFKRSRRWEYFFGLSSDGADTLGNICQCYFSKRNTGLPQVFDYMKNISGRQPQHPVIFLLDNEMKSDKPLKKFLQKQRITDEKRRQLVARLYIQIMDGTNLFLVTNPLANGDEESAIEILFPEEVLLHEIDGKKFSLENDYDTATYYGKELFSKYIEANYESLDFSGFRPLLNALAAAVETYRLSCNT